MKDLTIKASSIIRELLIFAGMLVAAFLTNVYAIWVHDGQWGELISQLHIVLLLSVVYYVLLVVIRLIIRGIMLLVKRFVNPDMQNKREATE